MANNPFSDGINVQLGADTAGFNQGIGNAITQLGDFRTAAGLAGGAVAAIGAVGMKKAIDDFASFDEAMANSQAIMGDLSDTAEDDMIDAARKVGRESLASAEEAAEAYFYLASAGLDAAESTEVLGDMAAFSQAGNFDMARATDILTDSASALGLEVSEYNDLADVMVKTNQLANTSVEQLGDAFTNKAAAQMRNLNMEYDEGAAVLAAFADQGIKGRKAGERMNILLRDLPQTAMDNAEAFEEMGVGVFDAEGELRDMADIVGDVEDATAGMSTEQRIAAMESLGLNKRVADSLTALTGTSDAIREYHGELGNAGGATEEVANKQTETFNAQLQLLKDSLTDISIGIGQELAPALGILVSGLQDGIDWFQRVDDKFDASLGTITLVAMTVGGLAAALGALGGVAALSAGAVAIIGTAASVAAGAIGILLGPIGLAIGAIALLWYAWNNNLGGIQDITRNAVATVRGYFDRFLGWLLPVWNDAFGGIGGEAMETFNFIRGGVARFTDWVQDKVGGFLSWLEAGWEAHGDFIMAVLTPLFENVKLMFELAFQTIGGIITFWLRVFRGDWSGAKDALLGIVGAWKEGVTQIFKNAMEALGTVARAGWDALVDWFWDTGVGRFLTMWGDLSGSIVDASGTMISDTIDTIVNGIKDGATRVVTAMRDAGEAAVQAFKDVFNDNIPSSISIPSRTISIPSWLGGGSVSVGGGSLSLPQLDEGGLIEETGLFVGHAGERVLNPAETRSLPELSGESGGDEYNFDVTVNADSRRGGREAGDGFAKALRSNGFNV